MKYPVPITPSKIIAVGLNYRDHAQELGQKIPEEPIIFLKPPTSMITSGQKIIYPPQSNRVDYEAELAIVIKERTSRISVPEAPKYILGYTCANDVTARDLQRKDGQWTRAKSFDTFCPLGPLVTDEIDPHNVALHLRVNGELRQTGHTKNFVFNVYELVSFISQVMTLFPGDIILTGTPAGIGPLQVGDTVEVEITGIGKLTNFVASP